jgi:outer membrane protein assembly factor BamB
VAPDDEKVLVGTNNANPRDAQAIGDQGILMCFSARDGQFLWQASHPRLAVRASDIPFSPIRSVPAVDEKRVYYVSNRGELVCVDLNGFYDGKDDGPFRETGRASLERADVVWTVDMVKMLGVFKRDAGDIGNPVSSPLVTRKRVYCVSGNGSTFGYDGMFGPDYVPKPDAPSFVAVDKKMGVLSWENNSPGNRIMYGQWGSPCEAVLSDGRQVIFPGGDGLLYGVNPTNGRVIWQADGNLPGAVGWSKGRRGTRTFCSAKPAVHGKMVVAPMYVDCERIKNIPCPIVAFDLAHIDSHGTGMVKWKFVDGVFQGSINRVIVTDSMVFAVDWQGVVVGIDAQTGSLVWRLILKESPSWDGSPRLYDGKLFIAAGSSLFVIEAGRGGRLIGEYVFDEVLVGTPVVVKNTVYVTTASEILVARLSPL